MSVIIWLVGLIAVPAISVAVVGWLWPIPGEEEQ